MKKFLSILAVVAVVAFGTAVVAQNVVNYMEQGGARWVIGGSLDVISGGDLDLEAGSTFKIAGTAISATPDELDDVTLQVHLEDTAVATTRHTVSHFAGSITDWACVLGTGFSGPDRVLTLAVNGAMVSTTHTLTITAAGSLSGDIDSATLTGVTVQNGQLVSIGSDGTTGGVATEMCTIVIER